MKSIKMIMMSVALLVEGTMLSFAGNPEEAAMVIVPSGIQSRVIDLAVSNHCISRSDGDILKSANAIQQCVDAFVRSGFDPSAAVDELADIAVRSGKFPGKKEAKSAMKATSEKLRKKESNWKKLYDILGL